MSARHAECCAARTKRRAFHTGASVMMRACAALAHARVRAAGFTLIELLVALTIALIVAAGVVKLADDARTFFLVQPEVMDVTQRARVGVDLLAGELTNAGAGASLGADAGPLIRWMPPIIPARYQGSSVGTGGGGAGGFDAAGEVFSDRLTIITAAEDVPFVAVRGAMISATAALPIAGTPGCPAGDALCGFRAGQRIAVFDRTAAFDLATVRTPVALPGPSPPSASADLLLDASPLAKAFRGEDDGRVLEVRTTTYYHDAARNQLRRVTGPRADGPVLDDVVGLSFRYFGERAPPSSPRPPPGAANCLFDVAGKPTTGVWGPDDGEQVELTAAVLTDGPWCGVAGGAGAVFDADLYRVRRIRVTLRIQANPVWARGRDPGLFQRPGTGTAPRLLVPDYVITFDVSPRNLGVGGMT